MFATPLPAVIRMDISDCTKVRRALALLLSVVQGTCPNTSVIVLMQCLLQRATSGA